MFILNLKTGDKHIATESLCRVKNEELTNIELFKKLKALEEDLAHFGLTKLSGDIFELIEIEDAKFALYNAQKVLKDGKPIEEKSIEEVIKELKSQISKLKRAEKKRIEEEEAKAEASRKEHEEKDNWSWRHGPTEETGYYD